MLKGYSLFMRHFPKTLALAIVLTLIALLLNNTPHVSAADPSFDPKKQFRVFISESEWFNYPSHLALRKTNLADEKDYETILCKEWGYGDCAPAGGNFVTKYFGTVILPQCAEGAPIYCIERLELKSGVGKWEEVKFSRHIKGPTQDPIPEIGYPGGGTISLFEPRDEDITFNVDGYAVYASFEIYDTAINQKEPRFEGLDLRVTPYKLENGKFSEQSISTTINESGRKSLFFSSFGEKIVWSESTQRGKTADFPQDLAARISLRVPNTVTGWLGGRLSKAEVSVKKVNARTNQLVIGGLPATVGIASSVLERASAPEFFKKGLENNPKSAGFGWRGSNGPFDVLNAIKDSMNDKSVSEETRWSLNSYSNSTTQCLQDDSKLVGLVTTNATAFDAVPPTFSAGILTYKIGGLHYDSKGSLTSGSYDLVMRSDVARCLYKFTNAPIQASISITYETGERKIATKVVNERDGWLYIGAYNFSFSSPTIEVRLTQAAVPTTKLKNVTILCTKGKVTKKLTATNPKCPAGFKKK
jgi:hypothetical protein